MNVFLKYKNGDYKINLENLILKVCVIILMM